MKALVVDDVATDRLNVVKILKSLGMDVYETDRASLAPDIAKSVKPDVIFMDVVMPDSVSGFEATRRITKDPETKHIPVIMVSSKNRAPDEMAGRMNGAKAYIFKPANKDSVAEKLRMLRLL